MQLKSLNFSKTVPLYFNFNKVSILDVQLDGLIYKTSDILRFRITAIDSRTRPLKFSKRSKISILDSKNNELKVWENVTFTLGMFEAHFKYSDLNEGNYEILTEIDEAVSSKIFKIQSDDRLETKITTIFLDMPKKVLIRDGFVDFKVQLFSFKKCNIAGSLNLLVEDATTDEIIFETNQEVNTSEVIMNLSFTKDLKIYAIAEERRNFIMRARFTDKVYKKDSSTSSDFSIQLSEYNVQLLNPLKAFKVGMTHTLEFLITNFVDERKIQLIENVKITVQTNENIKIVDGNFQITYDNIVLVKTAVIPPNTKLMYVHVILDDIEYSSIINKKHSNQNESISIEISSPR